MMANTNLKFHVFICHACGAAFKSQNAAQYHQQQQNAKHPPGKRGWRVVPILIEVIGDDSSHVSIDVLTSI